ncbi:MAG: TraB/TrbI/VirB10 family type IV secretion system protein [Syntrophorhabdaceae bacterium]
MRKLSKPAIGITIGVVAFAVVLSILIGVIMKNQSRTRLTKLEVGKNGSVPRKPGTDNAQETNPFIDDGKKKNGSTIGEAIEKEQEMLKESKKGGYIGSVGLSKKKKDREPLLDEMIAPESDENIFPGASRQKNKNIYNDGSERIEKSGEAPGDQAKKRAWEYIYAQKSSGGFMNSAHAATPQKDHTGPNSDTGRGSQLPKVLFYKPYRAVIDKTFTSADVKATFVATGSEIPLKNWKIIGKAAPNFSDYRFHVEISAMVGPDNSRHPMKGYAASIDESDGIISSVKHTDIAGTVTSGLMAGVSSFFNALRRDTTTIEVGSGGTVVTGQTKDEDRLREGGLAAGDTIFQGMSRKIESSAKKVPTLIMEKGVPVLVYFIP